jgi:pimeloyl-ACP methyl ester carboxylesterase
VDEYLERPQARIAFSRSGPDAAEHTLVVAHSLATSRSWEDEAGVFDWSPVLGAGHRLVRFDSRGHGESSGPEAEEQYRWPTLAEDLLGVSGAVSPDAAVDGLGESTGCGVLLWAVLAAPERFRRLVLVIPPTMGAEREEQAELYRAAAELIELRGPEAWQRMLSAATPPEILQEGGWTRPTWIPVWDELVPAVLRGAATSVFPDEAALRSIRQPTLILTWGTDPSHPLSTAEHLAAQLPAGTLEVATTPDGVRAWGRRAAEFLSA